MSPSTDSTTDYRQRLVVAIAIVISREGYGGTKIQDIVREAKVSLRTFYAEFPSKEACFLALYDQITRNLEAQTEAAIVFDKPWREVMADGFRMYLTALSGAPRLTYASLVELATLSDHARTVRQDAMDRYVDLLRDLVERGRAANPQIPSRPVSPLMGRAILGGLTEMMVDLVVRGHTERLPELVDVATDMLWSVVTNVEAAADTDRSLDAGFQENTPNSGAPADPDQAGTGVRR